MKYLRRFLAPEISEDPLWAAPTKPTKRPATASPVRDDPPPDFGEFLTGCANKTNETHTEVGSVGFVGVPDWEEVDAIGRTCALPGVSPRRPPRPGGPPSYGLTEAGHVVEIPRTPRESRDDPLRYVTGPGWPDWYDATDAEF